MGSRVLLIASSQEHKTAHQDHNLHDTMPFSVKRVTRWR
jgi:hypothetical protein